MCPGPETKAENGNKETNTIKTRKKKTPVIPYYVVGKKKKKGKIKKHNSIMDREKKTQTNQEPLQVKEERTAPSRTPQGSGREPLQGADTHTHTPPVLHGAPRPARPPPELRAAQPRADARLPAESPPDTRPQAKEVYSFCHFQCSGERRMQRRGSPSRATPSGESSSSKHRRTPNA